jgi:hypothetical protein
MISSGGMSLGDSEARGGGDLVSLRVLIVLG